MRRDAMSAGAGVRGGGAVRFRRGWRRLLRPLAAVGVVAGLAVWAAVTCGVSVEELIRGVGTGLEMVGWFLPPDLTAIGAMVMPALVTVLLAVVATPLGFVLSLGFGLAGARNLAPAWIRLPARFLVGVERALPEIVVLLLLVAALGIGPFPGVLALAIGSVGMLGKLLADAIEEIDPRVMESVECTGATRWQVIRHAVLPEVMPSLLANSIFRFEVNIRSSVLLGAVGAGGIGYELSRAMSLLEYERATSAVLVTIALVFCAERVSDHLRRRVLEGGRLT